MNKDNRTTQLLYSRILSSCLKNVLFSNSYSKRMSQLLIFFMFRIVPTSLIWSAKSLIPDAFNVNFVGKFKDHFLIENL